MKNSLTGFKILMTSHVNVLFSLRNPILSPEEAVRIVYPDIFAGLFSAYLASGFSRIADNNSLVATLLPCPLGTFSNSSAKGADGCIKCPPGMLWNLLSDYVTTFHSMSQVKNVINFSNAGDWYINVKILRQYWGYRPRLHYAGGV